MIHRNDHFICPPLRDQIQSEDYDTGAPEPNANVNTSQQLILQGDLGG
jgi:hypothetical protein